MSYDTYHKRRIGQHLLKPETQMMGYGFDPSLSEGSLKPPIFLKVGAGSRSIIQRVTTTFSDPRVTFAVAPSATAALPMVL